jgi:hypothetical protein
VSQRRALHSLFAVRFEADRLGGPAQRISVDVIDQAEEALDTFLPVSYREFLGACGPLFVPALWDAVVEKELGVEPVREFFTPSQVAADTRLYWSGGMPVDFIAIASDFCGNMFGFGRCDCRSPRPDDLPVFFFDHDFVRVTEVSASFDGWLGRYLELVPAA